MERNTVIEVTRIISTIFAVCLFLIWIVDYVNIDQQVQSHVPGEPYYCENLEDPDFNFWNCICPEGTEFYEGSNSCCTIPDPDEISGGGACYNCPYWQRKEIL